MTKPRTKGQVLIGLAVDAALLREIDARRGAVNRSAFVRTALADYLGLEAAVAAPPDRCGKGGRPRKAAVAAPDPLPLAAEPVPVYHAPKRKAAPG